MQTSRVAACFAIMAFAAVVAFVMLATSGRSRAAVTQEAAATVVAVQTSPVQRATVAQPVRGYGIVAASPSNVTTISLPYGVRITQLRVQPGQSVARGTPLVIVQADPAAVLAAAQAKSTVTLAQGEVARTRSLLDKGLATQSQLAGANKTLQDAQQALAAQNHLNIGTGSNTIAAPFDGVVLNVAVAQGDQIQAGAAILQLAAANGNKDMRANVMLGIEPSDVASIHTGDAVLLRGLSTSLVKTVAMGRVVMVGASVDAQSQLVNVGANVPLAQTPFIPGTRVSADIETRVGPHWAVPRSAVLKDAAGAYVFQISPDRKAHRVNVVIQVEESDHYGVDGPLDAARPVVTSGNYELQDGMAVQASGDAAQ